MVINGLRADCAFHSAAKRPSRTINGEERERERERERESEERGDRRGRTESNGDGDLASSCVSSQRETVPASFLALPRPPDRVAIDFIEAVRPTI